MDSIGLYLTALPLFLGGICLEALYYRLVLRRPYGWKVTVSNLVVAIGRLASEAATKGLVVAVYVAAWQHRLFDIRMDRWESWVALALVVDFAYYWLHRYSHEIRWMWALHSVHHSARQITFSVAYRLGWTNLVSGPWLFLIPVCWIGFDPRAVGLMYAANLLYQFWLHTETIPKLGLLEKFLNTPSNHRVHHAINPEYLDRNYGGVLIIWDRLFGTYCEEKDAVPREYGLVRQIDTLNPIKIAFAEWVAMLRDVISARSVREVAGYLFGPPGWRPDGNGLTTTAIRRAAGIADDTRRSGRNPTGLARSAGSGSVGG